MTKEESERYGREIDAKNAQYENVEFVADESGDSTNQSSPPLTEKEIRQRVGEQNFKNMTDGGP